MTLSPTVVAKGIVAFVLVSALWTLLATTVFLFGTGLHGDFAHPYYQWWLYLFAGPDDPRVNAWLRYGAAAATLVLVVGLLALLLRPNRGPRRLSRDHQQRRAASGNHGAAEWLAIGQAQALFPGPDPVFGGVVLGEAYRVDQDRVANRPFDPADRSSWGRGGRAPLLVDPCRSGPTHSLVFAGAGSFKSTSAVSTLLYWTGSAVVLDPSCELGPMLEGARRNMGHRVHQVGLRDGTGFNVLDWIDIAGPLATTHVLSVVNWMCGDGSAEGGGNAEFFESRGRALVACLLAHMLWDPETPAAGKTLGNLRAGLSLPEPELRGVLSYIHANSASGLARDYAGTLKDLVPETFSGIYANADESTAWLANPAFAAVVSGNGFTTAELLDGRCTVFLQIPLSALQTTPAVGRTLIGALLNAAYEADGRGRGRILYLLDEVARLGPMKIIETARDAGRKYGITLQLLYQSVGQLEKQWGVEGKREWYDGVSHRTYAAVQDLDTAKELEESFGTFGVITTSEGSNTGRSGKAFEGASHSKGGNVNYSEMSRPLIRHDELMNECRTDEAFVVVRGARPLRCGRAIYFRRPELVQRVSENRFARKPVPAN